MNVLGIDLGTSALKAVLVDEAQEILAEASTPLKIERPRPGWFEQSPDAWWHALIEALGRLRAALPSAFRETRALGLSGQMHGAVLLDRDGAVVRPAILWNDSRAAAECDSLQRAVPDLERIAGIIAMPGFTAPKLLWLRRHEPENSARIAKVVCPKDYLRQRLTGEVVTDMSDAAGTLWLDEAARQWSSPDPCRLRAHFERDAETGRGQRSERSRSPEHCHGAGLRPAVDCCRRRRRRCRRCDRHRGGRGGRCLRVARDFGAVLRYRRSLPSRNRARSFTPSHMRFRAAGSAWPRC